jgi:DNA-directed RNA polymerase subunit beta'
VVGDMFQAGDVNVLYRDLFQVLKSHTELNDTLGPSESLANNLNVYDSVKALYGMGEPVLPKTKARKVSGFLQKLIGNTAKFSFFQRKLMAKPVDFTGRGVIGVDPDLDIDEIAIPKDLAFKVYSPYIQRHMVRHGTPRSQALRAVAEKTPEALATLKDIVKTRPVVYTRSPAWHKFNITAGYPRLIDGDTIMINPLVTSGHNADFDGDTMNIHVPSMPEALSDAKDKLLPSKMLFSIKKRYDIVPVPQQELILGLYTAQRKPAQNIHEFNTEQEALGAIERGDVKLSDEVNINNF